MRDAGGAWQGRERNCSRNRLRWLRPTGGNLMKQGESEQYRDEADRLALLPVTDQREIIALHRSLASNPKIPKRDRDAGLKRAAALETLLGLAKRSRKGRSGNK